MEQLQISAGKKVAALGRELRYIEYKLKKKSQGKSKDKSKNPGASTSKGGSDEMEAARPSNITEEELQVKLAMQISQAEIDQSKSQQEMEDVKIKKAIEQSKLDERNRQIKQKEHETKKQDNNLLNLGLDPWSMPTQNEPKPQVNNYDPFSMNDQVEIKKSNPTVDPWATPTVNTTVPEPVNDPWGDSFNKPIVPPISNGFTANNDPFGTAFGASDPWEGAGKIQNSKSSELPILTTAIQNPQPILQQSQDLFNFDSIAPTTTETHNDVSRQKSKTPDFSNFLGERSADLVNLDNIAGMPSTNFVNPPTKQNTNIRSVSPSVFNNAPVASTNPFASAISTNTGGVFSSNYSTNSNPFATNTLGPTLNQIRAETNTVNNDPFASMDPFANTTQTGFSQTVPNNTANNESINPFF